MSSPPLSTREVIWVAGALLAGLVPHMQRFPAFLSLAFVGAALWRVLGAAGRLPLPDRSHPVLWAGKQFVAVLAFVTIYVAYRGQLGREAGVELLAALLGLKLLEMRNPRDYYVVTFLCYFLVVTNFFYSQTLATAVYMLGLVVFVTTVLIQFNTPPPRRDSARMLRLSATMTMQAMPLMIVAFLLFPRLPGPLWGLPQDAYDGVTGLSDELRLGEVARLGVSDEIAFRVEFHNDQPDDRDLYWRGPVLDKTDGVTWRAARLPSEAQQVERLGPSYRYTVMLEPHNERFLLGLDTVLVAKPPAIKTVDNHLIAAKPVRRRIAYELTSVVDYRLRPLGTSAREALLALPVRSHPRAKALAAEWVADDPRPLAVAERALTYYREHDFYYSLTPPALRGDNVDAFLFETREGFCEHFAASFVVLMRAAGIPARIVTGYQGGEYNALGDYFVVRQRDAHAWAEIYDEDRGWTRVDPTGAVAPERVSSGLDDALPRSAMRRAREGAMHSALLARLRDSVDAVTYGWNQWVLGYSTAAQKRLLGEFGVEDADYGTLVIALTVALAAAMLVLAVLVLRVARPRGDPAQAAWLEFGARLARIGLARLPSEAPRAYALRVAKRRADLAAEALAITRLYTQARYGRGRADLQALQRRVRAFHPRRA
ncbi:MAG: DUF3488 domain-containing transglutaminase family protein [Gammaproteobacteria bacterium]|nr:DUF3488 domain-containing transglutaminase family protein [Gammaproteobacteria bacterium]